MKRLVAVVGVLVALSTTGAQAQDAPTTTLLLDPPTRTSTPGQLVLSATLIGPNGKLFADRQIDFYQSVDLFGPREALLGGAVTDSAGVAVLLYLPVEQGRLSLIARFAGDNELARTEASASVDIVETSVPLATEPLPFASLRPLLPWGIGAAVAAVWCVLLGVLGYAVLNIQRSGSARHGESRP